LAKFYNIRYSTCDIVLEVLKIVMQYYYRHTLKKCNTLKVNAGVIEQILYIKFFTLLLEKYISQGLCWM